MSYPSASRLGTPKSTTGERYLFSWYESTPKDGKMYSIIAEHGMTCPVEDW